MRKILYRRGELPLELTILVMSCDKYNDTWEPFIICFRKYFANCPYQVVLCTESNSLGESLPFDRVIYSERTEWSGRLKDAMTKISSEFVFILLDDFWLRNYLDIPLFQRDLKFISTHKDIGTIYIDYVTWRFLTDYTEDYYEWGRGEIYRANTRPAFWRKDFLEHILDEQENVWQFERTASYRMDQIDYRVLCSKRKYLDFIFAVTNGKYEKDAIHLAHKEDFLLRTDYRKERTSFEDVRLKIRNKIFNIAPNTITKIKMRIDKKKR